MQSASYERGIFKFARVTPNKASGLVAKPKNVRSGEPQAEAWGYLFWRVLSMVKAEILHKILRPIIEIEDVTLILHP
jgi:hypothetical protein